MQQILCVRKLWNEDAATLECFTVAKRVGFVIVVNWCCLGRLDTFSCHCGWMADETHASQFPLPSMPNGDWFRSVLLLELILCSFTTSVSVNIQLSDATLYTVQSLVTQRLFVCLSVCRTVTEIVCLCRTVTHQLLSHHALLLLLAALDSQTDHWEPLAVMTLRHRSFPTHRFWTRHVLNDSRLTIFSLMARTFAVPGCVVTSLCIWANCTNGKKTAQ